MARRTLTDRFIKTRERAQPGTRYEVWDTVVPNFGVRVTDKGHKTFILMARFGGAKHPTRRELGEVGAITLANARDKAREWLNLMGEGRDPRDEIERQRLAEEQRRLAEERKKANSFAAVLED